MLKGYSIFGFISFLSLLLTVTILQPAQAETATTINLDKLHSQGSGEVIAVTYLDLECPFCKRFHNTMKKVLKTYDGKLVWGYKHFPMTTIHSKAKRESLASECAGEQDRFYPFINELFQETTFSNNLTDHKLVNIAKSASIEPKEFRHCLKNREYLKRINKNIAEGERLEIMGTPTTFVVDSTGVILDKIVGAESQQNIETILDKYVH